jgi:Lar family restriction alleviation protein
MTEKTRLTTRVRYHCGECDDWKPGSICHDCGHPCARYIARPDNVIVGAGPEPVMSEELKSCPFCGGDAEINQIGNEHTKSRGFEVKCLTWGCATKKRAMVIRQPLERARGFAIAAWNRRPDAARAEGPLEPRKDRDRGPETEALVERDGHFLNLAWTRRGVDFTARLYEPQMMGVCPALADVLALAVETPLRRAARAEGLSPAAPSEDKP